jgi:histidinol-phosphate aminotransferase
LTRRLLERGVIVRPMDAFGLGDGAIRISVGLPDENARCVAALQELLQDE